jgi:diacylglycerol kinase (ATP)
MILLMMPLPVPQIPFSPVISQPRSMDTLVIVNNTAANACRVWPVIQSQLNQARLNYRSYETRAAGEATEKTRSALKRGVNTILVVGGDGTLSEVAEGFFEFNSNVNILPQAINQDAKLAILPAGTGDDFARGLRGERTPLQSWIDAFLQHNDADAKKVDVLYGRCNSFQKPFICLNASTMGIGGETAGRVAAQGKLMRSFSGEFRFVVAAVGALAAWRERRVQVTVDSRLISDAPMNLIGVANGLYAGGGMMLSPGARVDDGKLDVVTASGLTRSGVITELSRVHRGGHVTNPKVNVTQGQIVRIETFLLQDAMPIEVDGNVRGVTPVQFQVMPEALRFVV